MSRPDLTLVRELEAALAWWQAAGVDHDFTDDATAWLAPAPLTPTHGTQPPGAGDARAASGAAAGPAHRPSRGAAAP
ncbi:hypothetical protein OPU67_15820, partial [Erythrobacter sp. WG]|nr:hypothetical protein [Erythrobacter sp. WG]